jgi:SAM-dependent methyltransferase
MQPSVWSVFQRRWNDTRSRKTFTATLKEIATEIWEFLLESTPERRRSRYGDVEYDWDHEGMDTTSATVSTRTRLLAAISGAPYQPTEPFIFAEMLNMLHIDFNRFTFIDIGSGKGRTLLMAAEFDFKKVIGVELLPELHNVAMRNIGANANGNITSVCVDGRDFPFPPEPLVVYLFNPLPEPALMQMMENLQTSLRHYPRDVKIIYHNPTCEHIIAQSPFKKLHSTYQYAIYST